MYNYKKHETTKFNPIQLSLSLLLIASPWIMLYITTIIIAHQSVFNSVPCWSDELAYWHEILSISQKGNNFGYYTLNEAVPTFFSFGTHGFGAVSVYALFGKLFGWKAYSIVIANVFFVSVAYLILVLLVKISSKNLILILLLTLTFPPLILYIPTSMTELLNFSILIIYSGLLHVFIKKKGKKWLFILISFCTLISFVRIIYIILFLPVLFKREKEFKFDFKFLVSFSLLIVFSAVLFSLNNLFVSPYPDSFLNELFQSKGLHDFVDTFVTHFIENSWNLINPVSENIIQVLQRYFLMVVLLICLVKSTIIQSKFRKIELDYFIVFFILFLFLLINIGAYDVFDWRDYRVLAPVLFGCVLYLILNNKRTVIYCAITFNIIGILFLFLSPQIVESFNKGRYTKPVENPLLSHIAYTEHPVSRFENTIILQQFNTNSILNIPAGIGISYSEILSDTLKSNYIFSQNKIKLKTYKLINSNTSGYLYTKISNK
jgi:hypothetical protein